MEDNPTEALILGNISRSDLIKYRIGEKGAALKSPVSQLEVPSQQQTIAKKLMTHFFQKELRYAPNVYVEDQATIDTQIFTGRSKDFKSEDFRLYEADRKLRRKIWLT